KAIYDGYGTRLEPRLHPQFVLHVTLPPQWIDVNVHPQKREIRLKDPLKMQEMIRKGIFQAFSRTSEVETPKQVWEINTPLKLQETFELPPAEETFSFVQEEIAFVGIFESYAIIHPTKLIDLPSEEGLILVDLEGAQARIRYERFLNKEPLPMQALLFPVAVNLSPHEKGQLDPHLEEIRGMGIDLRSFGDNCFIIDALTPDLDEKELQGLLEELADVYDQHLLDSFREKKLALSAAYFARSGKRTWGIMEAKQVIKALLKTSSPYHTPKGEKTMVDLSHDAIKKLFQKKSR
ncbi:MAG: hypothetical protein KDK76_06825, partial [Chlamydiia bacterium]|nr:hypothetical protein [Chlamydiia bacterium]